MFGKMPLRGTAPAKGCVAQRREGFVSDPLPLRGRPPLQGGQKTVLNQPTFLPLEKGETRAQRARGSISDFLCKAPPRRGGVDARSRKYREATFSFTRSGPGLRS